MYIQIFCEQRLTVARDIIDLLLRYRITPHRLDLSWRHGIYLECDKLDAQRLSEFIIDIRSLVDVKDVKTVPYSPKGRSICGLKNFVDAMDEPTMVTDVNGHICLLNQAALKILNHSPEHIQQQNFGDYISGYNVTQSLHNDLSNRRKFSQSIIIHSQPFLMDVSPIYSEDDKQVIIGAAVVIRAQVAVTHSQRQKKALNQDPFDHIVAVSPKMSETVVQAKKWAKLNAPLLIMGDTGTGKDVIALACHCCSDRSNMPFLALNCAALPDEVVESELFGHAAGAYPNALEDKKGFFELANGGSVLLDEIGEMSPRMQTKLLRFLSDGTFRRVGEEQPVHVDVRVICATQRNLVDLVAKGLFREDLFYRLNVLTLQIPPLRERRQDILPLTELFITLFADEQQINRPIISDDLTPLLTQYPWPGNVRQLKNAIYRGLTQLEGAILKASDILLPKSEAEAEPNTEALNGTLDEINKRFERSVLTELYHHYPSTRKLAKRLGVSHTAIANKLREYGVNSLKND